MPANLARALDQMRTEKYVDPRMLPEPADIVEPCDREHVAADVTPREPPRLTTALTD